MATYIVNGFSELPRNEKLKWLQEQVGLSQSSYQLLEEHLHSDPQLQ